METPRIWLDLGMTLTLTKDGSPSLVGSNEGMHHSGGALSETNLIYGQPIAEIFSKIKSPHFFILGLGLGYIELFCAAISISMGPVSKLPYFTLESRESQPELIDSFLKWIHGAEIGEAGKIYSLMELQITQSLLHEINGKSGPRLREILKKMYDDGQWVIGGSLDLNSPPLTKNIHGVMYDAYSSKTSPELWSYEFLSYLASESCSSDCLFSTYACTGHLKRSLAAQGFQLDLREGFRGKRASTLGRRGIFTI